MTFTCVEFAELLGMAEATYPSADPSVGDGQSRQQALNQKFGEFRKFVSTNFVRTKQVGLASAVGWEIMIPALHTCTEGRIFL